MCGALREFVAANGGQLPVRGVLPDMMADSDKYVSLQSVLVSNYNHSLYRFRSKSILSFIIFGFVGTEIKHPKMLRTFSVEASNY